MVLKVVVSSFEYSLLLISFVNSHSMVCINEIELDELFSSS